jgi:hypothetical protein
MRMAVERALAAPHGYGEGILIVRVLYNDTPRDRLASATSCVITNGLSQILWAWIQEHRYATWLQAAIIPTVSTSLSEVLRTCWAGAHGEVLFTIVSS